MAVALEEISSHPGCHKIILSSLGPLSAILSGVDTSQEVGKDLAATLAKMVVNISLLNSSKLVGDKKLVGVLIKLLGCAEDIAEDRVWMGILLLILNSLLLTERSTVLPLLSKTKAISTISKIVNMSVVGEGEAFAITILGTVKFLVEGLEGSENMRAFISNGVIRKLASFLSSSNAIEYEFSVALFDGVLGGGEMGAGYFEETSFRAAALGETLDLLPTMVKAASNPPSEKEESQHSLHFTITVCVMHPDPDIRNRLLGKIVDAGFFVRRKVPSAKAGGKAGEAPQRSKSVVERAIDGALSAERWAERARNSGTGNAKTDPLLSLEAVCKICSQATRNPSILDRLVSCGDYLGVNDAGSPVFNPESQIGVLMESARRIMQFMGKRAARWRGVDPEDESKIALNSVSIIICPLARLSPEAFPGSAVVNMGFLPLLTQLLVSNNPKLLANVLGVLVILFVRNRATRECVFASKSKCVRMKGLYDALKGMMGRMKSRTDPEVPTIMNHACILSDVIPLFVSIVVTPESSGKSALAKFCDLQVTGNPGREEMMEMAHQWTASLMGGSTMPAVTLHPATNDPGIIPSDWSLPRCSNPTCPAPTDSPLHRCGRCGKVKYCGVACQKADWKRHKSACAAAASKKAGKGKEKSKN